MPDGQALEFSGVTKRFGGITAVSDLTARVEPGAVTGFLGPNGAGKTTTLRILLGLVRPTAGTATIGGVPYAKLARPLQAVGAVLEASSFHPGRTAANHLAVYAQAAGITRSRVDEVLGLVGLADAAGRKVGGFSLGMRQRLGLAYALLGDPGVLVLDEPANGLDPEGIKWMRGFLRQLAREGRTVLTSSHLLAEVQQTVDSLLVISRGRLVFQGGLDELTDPSEYATVVDGPDRAALIGALSAAGVSFEVLRSGLTVRGLEPVQVGEIAAGAGVALSSLVRRGPALEEVFLDLVNGIRMHPSAAAPAGLAGGTPAAAAGVALGAVVGAEAQRDDAELDGAASDEGALAEAAVGGAEVADAAAAEDAAPDGEQADAASDEEQADAVPPSVVERDAAAAGFAVASTGIIDIIPGTTEGEGEGDGEDANEDEDDDPSDSERPWEDYVKTDSDLEADAFFASFHPEQAAAIAAAEAADQAAAADGDAAVEPMQEPEPEVQWKPEPDVVPGPEPDPLADPEPEPDDRVDLDQSEQHEGGEQR